jgi:hypothetical protein
MCGDAAWWAATEGGSGWCACKEFVQANGKEPFALFSFRKENQMTDI